MSCRHAQHVCRVLQRLVAGVSLVITILSCLELAESQKRYDPPHTTKANKTTNNHWKNKNKNKSNFFITHNSNPLLLPQPRSLRAPAAGAGAEANCNAFVSIPKTSGPPLSQPVADMRMASMGIWHCAHQFTVWLPADIDACVFGSGAGAPHRPNTSPGPAVIIGSGLSSTPV